MNSSADGFKGSEPFDATEGFGTILGCRLDVLRRALAASGNPIADALSAPCVENFFRGINYNVKDNRCYLQMQTLLDARLDDFNKRLRRIESRLDLVET